MMDKKMLFAPGPVMTTERVKMAALAPDICHRRPIFEKLYSKIRNNLLELFHGEKDEYTAARVHRRMKPFYLLWWIATKKFY